MSGTEETDNDPAEPGPSPPPPTSDARLDWRESAIGRPAGVDETSCVVNESRIEMTRPDSIVCKGQGQLRQSATRLGKGRTSRTADGDARAGRDDEVSFRASCSTSSL